MSKLWQSGEPFIWLTGGALALALLMVAGLIGLILHHGLGHFWPKSVLEVGLKNGTVLTGQVVERESIPGKLGEYRIKLKVGNRDLYGADFVWIDESQIARRESPADIVVIERTEWGLLVGRVKEIREGGHVIAQGPQAVAAMRERLPEARRVRREIRDIETGPIGVINHDQERIRIKA